MDLAKIVASRATIPELGRVLTIRFLSVFPAHWVTAARLTGLAPAMTQDKPPASPPPRPARAAGSASHRMESVGMGSFRGAGTAPAVVVLLTFRCKLGSARVATGRWTLIGN